MNLIEAWKKATNGQQIRLCPGYYLIKSDRKLPTILNLSVLTDAELLSEDWEIKKEKKILIFENMELGGIIGYKAVQTHFTDAGLIKPKIFTKIILEWEG